MTLNYFKARITHHLCLIQYESYVFGSYQVGSCHIHKLLWPHYLFVFDVLYECGTGLVKSALGVLVRYTVYTVDTILKFSFLTQHEIFVWAGKKDGSPSLFGKRQHQIWSGTFLPYSEVPNWSKPRFPHLYAWRIYHFDQQWDQLIWYKLYHINFIFIT